MDAQPNGWIRDPEAVDQVTERLAQLGPVAPCDVPGLKGFANHQINRGIVCVLALETERKAFGQDLPVKGQKRGTCTEQSGTYALTASWNADVALDRVVGVPKRIPVGPGYAMTWRHSRGQYGRTHAYDCRCGRCPDGLVIAHFAEVACTIGVIAEGVYGGHDLTKDREDLSINWAVNGVPQAILDEAKKIQAASYRCRTIDDLADCIWARYFGHQGSAKRFDGFDGHFARMGPGGNHAESIMGSYLDEAGELAFVRRNSHYGAPKGPYSIRVLGGQVIPLPSGAYPVSGRDMKAVIADGETWVYRIKEGWRS